MSEIKRPRVGDIVHFYDSSIPPEMNDGVGKGPYASIVVRRNEEPYCINVIVFSPRGMQDGRAFMLGQDGIWHERRRFMSTLTAFWLWPEESPVSG